MSIADINECAAGTPCNSGTCNNTPGTFDCDCTGSGFEGPTCSSGKSDNKIIHGVTSVASDIKVEIVSIK